MERQHRVALRDELRRGIGASRDRLKEIQAESESFELTLRRNGGAPDDDDGAAAAIAATVRAQQQRVAAEENLSEQIRATRMECDDHEAIAATATAALAQDLQSVAAMVDSKRHEHLDAAAARSNSSALAAWLRAEEDCVSNQRRINAALEELRDLSEIAPRNT
jgi:hypothetical protein